MTGIPGLPPALAAELAALNDEQRSAAVHTGDLAVLAGPGSGKTRALVAKAAYLLETQIQSRRGLAAITYTRHAAQEIRDRLDRLGAPPGRRLSAGTLHSWCLNSMLRPFGPLVRMPVPGLGAVIDDASNEWRDLLQACLDDAGANLNASYERHTIIRIRRRLAAGIAEDERDPLVQAALLFDERLRQQQRFDFDSMIGQSLELLRQESAVTRLVAGRFPWLLVDEYQDLGPVLHALVCHLHDVGGVRVAAFGDPDQTIMAFNGADPAFFRELIDRDGFDCVPLDINYRCGSAIIAASHAAVDGSRQHKANPSRSDIGLVEPVRASGGLVDHASLVVTKLDELVSKGVDRHQIAVFYPRKGPLLDELTAALTRSGHPYIHEGDQRLPNGDVIDFIRDCAARAVAGPQPVGYGDSGYVSRILSIDELRRAFHALLDANGLAHPPGHTLQRGLSRSLHAAGATDPLGPWLDQLVENTGLDKVAAASRQTRDRSAIDAVREAGSGHRMAVGDIAGAVRAGKVVLTTYHSAKGREWDFVIMPGLIDGILPLRQWSASIRRHLPAPPDKLEQDRRAFYVGLTRAKKAAILIYGDHWETPWGAKNRYGISPYVSAVLQRIAAA